jgi:hypothetical protein
MLECNDRDCLVCVRTLLRGTAQEWWEITLETIPPEHKTWDTFLERFDRRFIGEVYRSEMTRQFLEIKQGPRTVSEYNRAFTRLLRYAEGMVHSEKRKCQHYIRGLRPEYQAILRVGPKEDLSEVMNNALEIEIAEELKRAEKGKAKKEKESRQAGNGQPAPKKQREGGPSQTGRPTGWRADPPQRSIPPATSVASGGYQQRRPTAPVCPQCGRTHWGKCWGTTGGCFRCGDTGHRVRDCPLLQKQSRSVAPVESAPTQVPTQRQGGTGVRGGRTQGSRRETGGASEVRTTGRVSEALVPGRFYPLQQGLPEEEENVDRSNK